MAGLRLALERRLVLLGLGLQASVRVPSIDPFKLGIKCLNSAPNHQYRLLRRIVSG